MTKLENIEKRIESDLRSRLDGSGIMYRLFSRVKTRRSIEHKMSIKRDAYRAGKMIMQDIIGFRIVLYFQDDVDIVALYLSSKGLVRKSVDEPDAITFRPQRLNLTLQLPKEMVEDFRSELPEEYSQYIGSTYEVQIRTIFSEGWHEVEHDLRYKCKEDWIGYESYSRILNGVLGTLETAEWSMKSLFDELAMKNCQMGNFRAMFRNKFRIRFANDDFSEPVRMYLESNPDVTHSILEMDRTMLLFTLLNHPDVMPLTFDNILFILNRIELMKEAISKLEPATFSAKFLD